MLGNKRRGKGKRIRASSGFFETLASLRRLEGPERASRRRRVLTLPRGHGVTLFSSPSAAQLLSATQTTSQPGHQRTTRRILGHARAVKG